MKVLPSRKVTVPPGLPRPGDTTLTVAVKVTGRPVITKLRDPVITTEVSARSTACDKPCAMLAVKLPSPLYEAKSVWLPALSNFVLKLAVPAASVPVPIGADPSKNVTKPVGVPLPGAFAETVAVSVTVWPNTETRGDVLSVVVLPAWTTVCVNALAVLLELKLGSPL